jgi:hypothetical protein
VLRHVALFAWKPSVTEAQKQAAVAALRALPGAIGELRVFDVGPDAGINAGNFDFAVVADFDDRGGYLTYRDHPAHREVLTERIAPIVGHRAAVQFEIGDH